MTHAGCLLASVHLRNRAAECLFPLKYAACLLIQLTDMTLKRRI